MTQAHWLRDISGAFTTAADWSTGAVPGSSDDAIIDASGSTPYTVTAAGSITVGSFQTAANAFLDITGAFTALNGTGTGVSAGQVNVMNGATLTLQGVVAIPNLLYITGSTMPTTVVIGAAGVTLEGPFSFSAGNSLGSLILNFGGANEQIVGATDTAVLDIVNARVSGQGQLGEGKLIIKVEANGFIEAKGRGTLVVNTGTHTITNAGLIDAEGQPSSSLTPVEGLIESPVENTGILEADGRGASLIVQGAVTGVGGRGVITGGVLEFDSTFNQSVTFNGNNGELVLAHAQGFNSPVIAFSPTGGESLDLRDIGFVGATEASFSGVSSGGVLTVSDGVHTTSFALRGRDYLGSIFVASADGEGGVQITTAAPLQWLNAVSGEFATSADWSTGAVPGIDDEAILDASGGASYTVKVSAPQSVAVIETATDATLDVEAAFTASNGTGAGANAGAIKIGAAALTLGGGVANSGSVNLAGSSSGVASIIIAGAGVTLSGGGKVALGGDQVHDTITGSTAAATLTNVDNTIAGGGQLGAGELTLINRAAGVIDADAAAALTLNTAARTVVNAGTIEASGSGKLFVQGSVVDDSSGGRIVAAGGQVQLRGARVIGGTLASSGAGIVWAIGGGNVLDGRSGHAVTLAGNVRIANGGSLTIEGAIVNAAVTYIGGLSTTSKMLVAGSATLTGGGRVAFGDSASNEIVATSTATFTNIDNVITAAGFIGGAGLTLVNGAGGVINGYSSATGLTIDTGTNTVANAGTIDSTGSGAVVIKSAVTNTGLLFAVAGTLTLDGAVTGAGIGQIKTGVLNIAAAFAETINFVSGATGQLRLTDFKDFTGAVRGFSKSGTNTLDLAGFTLTGAKASYSGTTASGVLTVTNGTQTAKIKLTGDYTGSTFTLASDGHGGVLIKDPQISTTAAGPLAQALAGFCGTPAVRSAHGPASEHSAGPFTLSRPI